MHCFFSPLIPADIPGLQNKHTLYSLDMRAASEGLEYDIPANWGYENLLPWILHSHMFVAVNDTYDIHDETFQHTATIAPKAALARVSLYDRLPAPPQGVQHLWVGTPHPSAENYAKKHGLTINATYQSFLEKNDKMTQKELLGPRTPAWTRSRPKTQDYFVKRRHGSGGYTVFPLRSAEQDQGFLDMYQEAPGDWFYEKEVSGTPSSIACFRTQGGDIHVFGYTEQLIENGRNFVGSRILPLERLSEKMRLQIQDALERLSPLLTDEVDFFGIDFMLQEDETVWVLEANIRITSATIPVLLAHKYGFQEALFREHASAISPNDALVLVTHHTEEGIFYDTLSRVD